MKRPLVFYSISTAIGCLSTMEFFNDFIVGMTIAVLFFIIYFFTLDRKFFIINAMFFILASFSFMCYFNMYLDTNEKIRVVQKKSYYFIGNFKGRKVILTGKTEKLEEGSRIEAYGSFEKNNDFSRGIIGRYTIKNYKPLKHDMIYYIYEYKKFIYNKFKNKIGEDRTALVMGICYGDTQYLTSDQNQEFQKLGVVHAVSVSGFHMAILYQFIECILGFKAAVIFSMLYVVFTGMSAATVRSFIMIFIFKMSKVFFREYDSLSSLSLAAIILIMAKPYNVVDIGFSLSFLATLGIILYYKKFSMKFYMLPKKLNESISITLASQIYSMPYIAFTIQNFSYGFILGNLFLLPLYSAIVVLGNVALIFSFLKQAFDLITIPLNMVLTASEGANSIILKFCPDIIYLSYEQGIIMLLLYMSYVLYKSGYKKIKYLPAAVLIAVFIQNYSFITEITFLNFKSGEAVILNNGSKKFMMCNYDSFSSKWVTNIRDSMNVDKIVTNPSQNYIYKLNNNSFLNINPENKDELIVKLCNNNEEINFVLDKQYESDIKTSDRNLIYIPKLKSDSSMSNGNVLDKSCSYVIIFNRAIKIK